VIYKWNATKAARNLRKHGVSFDEAVTVFQDPFALTFDDPDHSIEERRFLTIGTSVRQRILFVAHADRGEDRIRIIRPEEPHGVKAMRTKNAVAENNDELRPHYDLSALKGEVRGKYHGQATRGTTLVLLEPDVAEAFPDGRTVNETLRAFVKVARSQKFATSAGGRKTTSRTRRATTAKAKRTAR
jgi:uncharacterized DUF497 family protein